jgi:hypothetical protein
MPQKLKCIVCGYTEIADTPPKRCPVCSAESDRFNVIPFSPEWLDVEPVVETIHIADSIDISNCEKSLSFNLSAENLVIQSGESVDDFSLDNDSVLIVLDGEASVTSDNPIKIFRADSADHTEGVDSDPELFTEDVESHDGPVEPESSGLINKQSSDNLIRKNHIIFLPGSTGLSIRNTGESQLAILVVY